MPPRRGGAGGGAGAAAAKCPPCVCNASGGEIVYRDDAVQVRTGVTVTCTGMTPFDNGIEFANRCPKNPHNLQFINREIIGKNGHHVAAPIHTTGGTYNLTTDPKKPNWNTDSSTKPNPNYEAAGVNCKTMMGLVTWDKPDLAPKKGETWKANFSTFIICDGKVVREVQWSFTQTGLAAPVYAVNVNKVGALPGWANTTLNNQGYNLAP